MADYVPRNSMTVQTKEERTPQKAVVNSATKIKKKSMWEKIKEEFVSDDGKSIGDYIVLDILVPAAKNTIQSVVNNGIDMILYGGSAPRSNRNSYTNYPVNNASYRPYYERNNQNRNDYSGTRPGNVYDYSQVEFSSRADAEEVLFRMRELFSVYNYPVVRVADYLEFSGLGSSFVDNNYGWTNLENVQVRRSRNGGYFLDLPRPMAID